MCFACLHLVFRLVSREESLLLLHPRLGCKCECTFVSKPRGLHSSRSTAIGSDISDTSLVDDLVRQSALSDFDFEDEASAITEDHWWIDASGVIGHNVELDFSWPWALPSLAPLVAQPYPWSQDDTFIAATGCPSIGSKGNAADGWAG